MKEWRAATSGGGARGSGSERLLSIFLFISCFLDAENCLCRWLEVEEAGTCFSLFFCSLQGREQAKLGRAVLLRWFTRACKHDSVIFFFKGKIVHYF